MGWSELWKRLKEVFDAEEVSLSKALAKIEPVLPEPYRTPAEGNIVVLDLMYNVQGADKHPAEVIEKFKSKSRRRAIRYFSGKEVKHRVTARKDDSIEFEFARTTGNPVRIRWTNKVAET